MLFVFDFVKGIILFFSAILLAASCTSETEQKVVLFNGATFELKEGEEIVEIDTDKKEVYNHYAQKEYIQIPVYKCVTHEKYSIFLGIPINTSIKKIIEYNSLHRRDITLLESDSINYFYATYENENNYVVEYAKTSENNLFYILVVSDIVERSGASFNKNALSKRFNK